MYPWNANNINFEKYLGKNLGVKSTVDQHYSTNNSLNLNTFRDNIVGPDILAKCNNFDHTKKLHLFLKNLKHYLMYTIY